MNIKAKIVHNTIIIAFILVVCSIMFLIIQSNKLGKNIIFSLQNDRLTSIRYFKTLEIESYFNNLIENISILTANREIINGLEEFTKTFPKYLTEVIRLNKGYKSKIINNYFNDFVAKYQYYNQGENIDPKNLINLLSENSFALQYNYIFNNSYNLSNKDQLHSINDGTSYSLMHAKYHHSMLAYKQQFGFQDILLVDRSGNIVYSTNKQLDFTTSLINGPYSKSNLAEVFKKIMVNNQENFIAIADFAPYLAYYNNPAAFIGIAVNNEVGQKIGALIVQISIEKINNIMSNQEQWNKIGLGETINTSIIGSDFKLRTNNRFFIENSEHFLHELIKAGIDQNIVNSIKVKNSLIGILTTDTLAVKEAFNGKEGFAEYLDYRKIPVISSFAPLKIPGLNWAIVVKMHKNEALLPISGFKRQIILNGFIIITILTIIAAILATRVANHIVDCIYNITDQINQISETQDLTIRLAVSSDSEFSSMSHAFNNFIARLQNHLKNIINIVKNTHVNLATNENFITESNNNHLKSNNEAFAVNDKLYEQIHNLSQEFKLIEAENERTKYW